MKRLLAALLLAPALCGAEQFDKQVRDFSSRDGKYQLRVGYSGSGGAGRARATLSGPDGRKISTFETDRPPFSVSIPGGGRRLFFFCGAWGQSVSIFGVEVFSQAGEKLAWHPLQMSGTAGEDFSDDGSVYALGADQGGTRSVLLFDAGTGKLLWKKKSPDKLAGLKLSGDGSRLLALYARKADWLAVVYGKAGGEIGRAAVESDNNLTPRAFSRDGTSFELWENTNVFEKDGYFHAKLVKKRSYRLTPSGIEAAGVRDLYEDFR